MIAAEQFFILNQNFFQTAFSQLLGFARRNFFAGFGGNFCRLLASTRS
jgi:hypothetical protein